MSDIKYNTYQLPNISLIKAQLPTDMYNSVMSEVKEIQNYGNTRKWNHKLAGALEKEYELIKSRSFLVPYLTDLAKEYKKENDKIYNGVHNPNPFEYEVGELWVNYQQKNEYNPIHNHRGDLSFVLWMEIPFKKSDEMEVKNVVNSNSKHVASTFQFVYTNIVGTISPFSLPVENGWEGRLIMFPAGLFHLVYPFQTSDGYRISISGNLTLTSPPSNNSPKAFEI